MKIGDLVRKIEGYRPTPPEYFTGIVVGFKNENNCEKVVVVTYEPFLESWVRSFCEVVNVT